MAKIFGMPQNTFLLVLVAIGAIWYFGMGGQAASISQGGTTPGSPSCQLDGTNDVYVQAPNPETTTYEQEPATVYLVDSSGTVLPGAAALTGGTSNVPTTVSVGCGRTGTAYTVYTGGFSGNSGVPFSATSSTNGPFQIPTANESNPLPALFRTTGFANDTIGAAADPAYVYSPSTSVKTVGAGSSTEYYVDLLYNVTAGRYGAVGLETDGVVIVVDLPITAITPQGFSLASQTGWFNLQQVPCSDERVAKAASAVGSNDVCYVGPAMTTRKGLVRLYGKATADAGNPGATDDVVMRVYSRVPFVDTDGKVKIGTHTSAGAVAGAAVTTATLDLA